MDVIMPQLGETVLEGSVAHWYKNVGDPIKADDPLFDVETDKVTTEIPAPTSGIVTEILVGVGVAVKVGTRLAVIEEGTTSARASTSPDPDATPASAAQHSAPEVSQHSSGRPLPRSPAGAPRLSPVVRRLLGEHGIAPERIVPSGPRGRITREDALAYVSGLSEESLPTSVSAVSPMAGVAPGPESVMASAPVALSRFNSETSIASDALRGSSVSPDDRLIPLSKVRRLTAAHMVRSKATSPHTLQAVEVDFHKVDEARKAVSEQWKGEEGYALTYLPFIARAACEAINQFPYVNSSFREQALLVHKRVHLGIAVDLNFEGLMAPVVRDAHHRNLRGLAAEIHRLARAARDGTLRQDDLAGGTYTISNNGSYGTLFTAPIINQPQAAILSADAVRKRPIVVEGLGGDAIAIRPVGILAQSFDHRAFDGAYSAAFLRCLREIIETRDWLAECT